MINRKCKIVILDEVNCVFVGVHPDHIGYFYEEYSTYAPNYFFNPKFKLGSWDGKIRFFHKTGKTYVKLLDDMIPRLLGLKYAVQIEDRREGFSVAPEPIEEDFFAKIGVTNPKTGMPWIMRDYQIELVNRLIDNGGGVAIAATGAGKTCCCAALARSYEIAGGLRSIIIVPDKGLTIQTKQNYKNFKLDVGEYSGKIKDLEHQHVVSTWQALKNRPETIQQFQVAIVDECHGLKGNVLTKLMNEYGKSIPYRYGVTGTLPKEEADAYAVKISVGLVQYTIPAHLLIHEGTLSDIQINVIQHEFDLHSQFRDYLEEDEQICPVTGKVLPKLTYSKFKDGYFPDWSSEKAFLQRDPDRLEWIADFIDEKRSQAKGNTLCLVNGIKFGKKLSQKVEGSYFLYGDDDAKDRQAIYDLFQTEDNITVIATVNIASTGLDIPRIFNLIYIDVGKSFIRVIQAIGRGLRTAHDKDFINVYDICSDLKYSKSHLRERIKYYKEAKYPYNKKVIQHTEREQYADF